MAGWSKTWTVCGSDRTGPGNTGGGGGQSASMSHLLRPLGRMVAAVGGRRLMTVGRHSTSLAYLVVQLLLCRLLGLQRGSVGGAVAAHVILQPVHRLRGRSRQRQRGEPAGRPHSRLPTSRARLFLSRLPEASQTLSPPTLNPPAATDSPPFLFCAAVSFSRTS